MATQGFQVQARPVGVQQTTQQLRGLGSSLRSLATPLLGGGLLTGLLGGSLLSLALGGGTASNAMIRLQDTLERLFAPLGQLFNQFLDWFDQLPTWAQYTLALGTAFTFLLGPIRAVGAALLGLGLKAFANPIGLIVLAVIALAAAFYLLLTRVEPFRNFIRDLQEGFNNLPGPIRTAINTLAGFLIPLLGIYRLGTAIRELFSGNFSGAWRAFTGQSDNDLITPGGQLRVLPQQSDFFRQPGADFFALTPFERNLLGGIGLVPGATTNNQGGNNIVNVNNIYTPYPDRTEERLADQNLRDRLNGGF